jgi:hypothetical protein
VYTHLWNPIGFPLLYIDEGHYMRRAMNILEGVGPQETDRDFHHPFDHPYFGQLFLAGIFKIIGYPDSVNPVEGDVHSIERIWLVPRVLMGLLAVVDTFLIYKIAEKRYNRNVAFIASVLFAVMPLSLMIRSVWLESIQLPFILLSILFATYCNSDSEKPGKINLKNTMSILVSATALGVAIFTKIPAFILIPLVGLLIFTNFHKNPKAVALWLIPTILIPLSWPAYALSLGQFEEWSDGVLWQGTERKGEGHTLSDDIKILFYMDPVLVALGVAGIIFAAVKKDLLIILWVIPVLILFYFVGHTSYWYLIPLIPVLCIGIAKLIVDPISNFIHNKKAQECIVLSVISALAIFGLVSTSLIITTNLNSHRFELQAFISDYLPKTNDGEEKNDNDQKVSFVGDRRTRFLMEVPKYVFNKDVEFFDVKSKKDVVNEKALLIVDKNFKRLLSKDKNEDRLERNQILYNNSVPILKLNNKADRYPLDQYPYEILRDRQGIGRQVVIKANY